MTDFPRISGPGINVQTSALGIGLIPDKKIKPVWGEITDKHPAGDPAHHFQWEEVYKDEKDNVWKPLPDSSYGSAIKPPQKLLEPAVERNFHDVQIGSIVRLHPAPLHLDQDGDVHRYWHFDYHQIRPFKLMADLIPTGGGEPDATIAAEWLDSPGTLVYLYPAHASGHPSGDAFLSHGVGQGPGGYFRGTYGWARYQPEGTIIDVNPDGSPKWRGEWQIVELYAETIEELIVKTGMIEPAAVGVADLYLMNKNMAAPSIVMSGYEVALFNDLQAPLEVGTKVKCKFDKAAYVWRPINLQHPSGITIFDSGAGQNSTANYVVVACDQPGPSYGLNLTQNGNTIKNDGDGELIGVVSWQFCARRDLAALPADCHAICHCAIFNNGAIINHTESQQSSSRRVNVAGQGNRAVNTNSGSVIVKLKSGEALDMRFKHSLSFDAGVNDKFVTKPGINHITFHTIPDTVLNP